MRASAIRIFSAILLTSFFFLALIIIGLLTRTETKIGFPVWFWKQSCSISINPETGATSGSTFTINHLHLALDIIIALLPAYFVTSKIAKRLHANKNRPKKDKGTAMQSLL